MNNQPTPLKPNQQITLQSFLIALSELDTALPENLQPAIHQIGHSLAKGEKTGINRISELVSHHPQLNQLYQQARLNFQRQYQSQERDKLFIYGSDTLALEKTAITLLTADDFLSAAKQLVNQANTVKDSFLASLQQSISLAEARSNLQAISILQALEFKPLTIENLVYTLNLPQEKVHHLVQRLWNEGKIDTVTGGILRKIFPTLRSKKQLNESAYFTLTSLGYFHLHPLIDIQIIFRGKGVRHAPLQANQPRIF